MSNENSTVDNSHDLRHIWNSVRRYAVSAGRLPDSKFLRDLSKITGRSFFQIESTKDLGAVFLGILEEFRQRYLLTYLPQGVLKSGWHTLKVRVKRRGVEVNHRPGYLKD